MINENYCFHCVFICLIKCITCEKKADMKEMYRQSETDRLVMEPEWWQPRQWSFLRDIHLSLILSPVIRSHTLSTAASGHLVRLLDHILDHKHSYTNTCRTKTHIFSFSFPSCKCMLALFVSAVPVTVDTPWPESSGSCPSEAPSEHF